MSVPRETPGHPVPRETRDRLDAYVTLLLRWNAAHNLIGRSTSADVWDRHVDDSLQLLHLVGTARTGIDLGSGAGFPGLVLAIASGVAFTLVEADQRKSAFLWEAVRLTGAPARVAAQRIEAFSGPRADILTARALAKLTILLSYADRLLAPGGKALFLKGRGVAAELAEAAAEGWVFDAAQHPSRTGDGVILSVANIRRG